MPKWIQVVILIVVFFAVAALYEHWRTQALDTWRRARGFTHIDPFIAADHPEITGLVSQITGRGDGLTRRYASAIVAAASGARVTLVEFEYTPTGRKTSAWFTLAVWPAQARRRALPASARGGQFAFVDGYAGWMTEGLLTPSRGDQILAQVAEARRMIEE
ncbi:MAG: hypothetical protein IT162_06250 [Bryobacterales bacterium]|nr:hypothetical protein [Bryobacterales bacterium]